MSAAKPLAKDEPGEILIRVLQSALRDLTSTNEHGQIASDQARLLFPSGINFISLSVTVEPTQAGFTASLTISGTAQGQTISAKVDHDHTGIEQWKVSDKEAMKTGG